MRTIDEIAIPIDTILSLHIEGLPSTNRGMRNYANKNGWPIVYDASNKYLILVDAVPEPYGESIRNGLLPSVSPPSTYTSSHDNELAQKPAYSSIAEARLFVVFEVMRRSLYVWKRDAIASFVEDYRTRTLPAYLKEASDMATMGGSCSGPSYSTILRWVDKLCKNGPAGLLPRSGK